MSSVQKIFSRFFGKSRIIGMVAIDKGQGDQIDYLSSCKSIIHIGANAGQERDVYQARELSVVWIEADPIVYQELVKNIEQYKNQTAINSLITDQDDQDYIFHISSNDGHSSSILDLHQHKDIWPTVKYVKDIELKSMTLTTALRRANLRRARYDALILDTQGSELSVLHGATDILPTLRYVKTEAADFESYRNCATADEISKFLSGFGYRLVGSEKFAERAAGGAYFNLLFKREGWSWRRSAAARWWMKSGGRVL